MELLKTYEETGFVEGATAAGKAVAKKLKENIEDPFVRKAVLDLVKESVLEVIAEKKED